MTQRIQHRRSNSPAPAWLTALQPGEVHVNPVRRDVAVGDFDGTSRPILGVRTYDERSQYELLDLVARNGTILRCVVAITTPHAFDPGDWEDTSLSVDDLIPVFDLRYSPLDHEHDAQYSALGHNHDGTYAPVVHSHDGVYSPVGHNHDTVYGRLSNSNQWLAVNTFTDILQATGGYAQVAGDLSIGGGSGIFVPDAQLSVRDNGQVNVQIRALDAGQQARLTLMNPDRQWAVYMLGNKFAIQDLSGVSDRLVLNATTDPSAIITGNTRITGTLTAQNSPTFGLLGDATTRKVGFNATEWLEAPAAGGPLKAFVAGSERLAVGLDGSLRVNDLQTIVDTFGHLVCRAYTTAARPSAAANPWRIIAVTNDEFAPLQISNGTSWLKVASPNAGGGGETPPGP